MMIETQVQMAMTEKVSVIFILIVGTIAKLIISDDSPRPAHDELDVAE